MTYIAVTIRRPGRRGSSFTFDRLARIRLAFVTRGASTLVSDKDILLLVLATIAVMMFVTGVVLVGGGL